MNYRPLTSRVNIVLSGNPDLVLVGSSREIKNNEQNICSSLNDALELVSSKFNHTSQVFIIGGASLYAEAMKHTQCDKIYLTLVLRDFPGDTVVSPIDTKSFNLLDVGEVQLDKASGVPFQFLVYQKMLTV